MGSPTITQSGIIAICLTSASRQTLVYSIMKWYLEGGGVCETTFYIPLQSSLFTWSVMQFRLSHIPQQLFRAGSSLRIRTIIKKAGVGGGGVKMWENVKKREENVAHKVRACARRILRTATPFRSLLWNWISHLVRRKTVEQEASAQSGTKNPKKTTTKKQSAQLFAVW